MNEIKDIERILVFKLDKGRYALDSLCVERVVLMVEITSLPKAPDIVIGIVDFHGEIVSVVDIRKRFRLKEKKISPADYLVIARTSKRTVAVIVDAVEGVRNLEPGQKTKGDTSKPFADYLSGVVKTQEGLILIHDLDLFLELDEETALNSAFEELNKPRDL